MEKHSIRTKSIEGVTHLRSINLQFHTIDGLDNILNIAGISAARFELHPICKEKDEIVIGPY